MSAPGKSTWDVVPPYRPGSADFNGAALTDDPAFPPTPPTMPTAGLLNTQSSSAVSYGKVVPNLVISVKFVSGNPALDSFTSAASAPTPSTFTIARTGGGAANGDISITWPANTFPAPVAQPTISLNGLVVGLPTATAITNGVRCLSTNIGGTGTDLPFTLTLY